TFLLRFSAAHGRRAVTAALVEDGAWVTLRVEMAGPPPQPATDYFMPRPETPAPATGLELAACRSIVQRAGGRLRATGQPGGGPVVVQIDLPAAPRSA